MHKEAAANEVSTVVRSNSQKYCETNAISGMMSKVRYSSVRFALRMMHGVGFHKVGGRWSRGLGVILTLHHVRPATDEAFAPSGILEITPEFLDEVIVHLKTEGYEIVRMSDVPERIKQADGSRPFVALTFDDGYRDNAEYALPILRKHDAPCTVYVARGFAEHTANMWWRDLEAIIRREPEVRCRIEHAAYDLPTYTPLQKNRAYLALYWHLRDLDEQPLRRAIEDLKATYPVDSEASVATLCMDWHELTAFAADPLVTIGAHTLTHPKLAGCSVEDARREMEESRVIIEEKIGIRPRHIAYPFGDISSAGPREFAIAREAGFDTGVTTRPGMIFPEHAGHLTALPRLSLNGYFQNIPEVSVLLSGLPFASMRLGRRLNIA